MHAAQNKTITFYISVESAQDSSSIFVFFFQSPSLSFFFISLQHLQIIQKNRASLLSYAHTSSFFIHSYKASHFKALIRVNFYFWLVEALEIEVIVCCPVTSVVFYFIILYLFFWCRTPRRWVNPSEWNHNAPHFRNIHRGWLILRIFSHHLRLLLLISVNL